MSIERRKDDGHSSGQELVLTPGSGGFPARARKPKEVIASTRGRRARWTATILPVGDPLLQHTGPEIWEDCAAMG